MPIFKSRIGKWFMSLLCLGIIVIGAMYWLIQDAYPEVRCEAVHLVDKSAMGGDCYQCHKKVTPKVAQNWYESKHGVLLVKCYVCHGQPDGKGAIPFAVNPDPQRVCSPCHAPAMQRMETKFGLNPECSSCHVYHQNSIHHDAFSKTESKKSL